MAGAGKRVVQLTVRLIVFFFKAARAARENPAAANWSQIAHPQCPCLFAGK